MYFLVGGPRVVDVSQVDGNLRLEQGKMVAHIRTGRRIARVTPVSRAPISGDAEADFVRNLNGLRPVNKSMFAANDW